MLRISDLPPWLREGIGDGQGSSMETVRNRVASFRAAYHRLTYSECLRILAHEFISRKRPRTWMVRLLMGRLNRLRNEQFSSDIAHLQTWGFR